MLNLPETQKIKSPHQSVTNGKEVKQPILDNLKGEDMVTKGTVQLQKAKVRLAELPDLHNVHFVQETLQSKQ